MPAAYRRVLITYAAVTLLLWTVPLLSVLHAESSAIIAACAFFTAGLSSISLFRQGHAVPRVLALQLAALLIPWTLLTVTALWQPNCGYLQGLILFALFPGISVVFSVSVARLLSTLPARRKSMILIAVGLALLTLPPLFDLGLHPQFYTYNHVFGGFLGPIYDEELAIRGGLFAFRFLTVLWSALLILSARFVETRRGIGMMCVIGIGIAACYLFSERLGFVTTHQVIREALGSVHRTAHFDIYYDADFVDGDELRLIAEEHEFRYARLSSTLGVDVNGRIQSYLYPTPDLKGRLTGARYTNVAPVWLDIPQMHILLSQLSNVMGHEMVHVFSREFGMPVLNASPKVGLVEGLAVALEPPDGRPGPDEQVSAAMTWNDRSPDDGSRITENLVARLSPVGFWAGRGAVSYTVMGSFVKFLIDAYGAESFKQVYAGASFEKVYGRSVEALAEEWQAMLLSLPAVARSAADLAAFRFSVPSLFEKECPHYVPAYREAYLDASTRLAAGDTLDALRLSAASLEDQPEYIPALDLWARLTLATSKPEDVLARLDRVRADSASAALLVRRGDALAMLSRGAEARGAYRAALRLLPSYAHETVGQIALRIAISDDAHAARHLVAGSDYAGEPTGPVQIAAALRAGWEGRYEQAAELLRRTEDGILIGDENRRGGSWSGMTWSDEELDRRRLVWMAEFAYRAGQKSDAREYAASAADAYRAIGAFNQAKLLEDFQMRISWSTTEVTLSGATASMLDQESEPR